MPKLRPMRPETRKWTRQKADTLAREALLQALLRAVPAFAQLQGSTAAPPEPHSRRSVHRVEWLDPASGVIWHDLSRHRQHFRSYRLRAEGLPSSAAGPAGITSPRKLAAAGIPVRHLRSRRGRIHRGIRRLSIAGTIGRRPLFRSRHHRGFAISAARPTTGPAGAGSWTTSTSRPNPGCPTAAGRSGASISTVSGRVHDILDLTQFEPIADRRFRWVQLIKSPAVRFAREIPRRDRTEQTDRAGAQYLCAELDRQRHAGDRLNLWADGVDAGHLFAPLFCALHRRAREFAAAAVVERADPTAASCRMPSARPLLDGASACSEGGNAYPDRRGRVRLDDDGEAFFSPSLEAMDDARS